MVGIIPRKAKRITASFLAVCVFAMAVLPYGNIAFANDFVDEVPSIDKKTDENNLETNEKLIVATKEGSVTVEESNEEKEKASNEETNKESEEQVSNEEANKESEEQVSNEEANKEPEEQVSNEETNKEPKEEANSEGTNNEAKEEVSNEPEEVTNPSEEGNSEPEIKPTLSEEYEKLGEMTDEEYIKFFEEMSEEEYMNFLSEYGEINTLVNDPTLGNFTVNILRDEVAITTGYAKLGDTLVLEYTAQNCTDALNVIIGDKTYVVKDLTESTDVKLKSLGDNKYSLSKVLAQEDTAGPISIKFTDGKLSWNVSTNIVYDTTLPTLSTRVEYGNLNSKKATIYGTPSDNNGIAEVTIWINGEWQSISGVKDKEEFSYVVEAIATYKIKVTDLAGNFIIKEDINVDSGNTGMIVRKLPTKVAYITNEDISLEGGYLKITNTFGGTIQDENAELVCFREGECACSDENGVCTPKADCVECEYVIPMELALITGIEESSQEGNVTHKKVKLRYGNYDANFDITVEDTSKYNVTITPKEGTISDDETITVNVAIEKVKDSFEDITGKWYTWSTMPDNIGNEVYTASFGNDIGVFSYEDVQDSTKPWEYDEVNEMYKSGYIGYGKGNTYSSKKRIIINTKDENDLMNKSGIISFEYKTNSPSGDKLIVSINDEEVLTRDGKAEWRSFSKQVTNNDGKYIVDLSFERSGVTSGSSKDYVAIRNLTFSGERKWKVLPEDGKVTLSSQNVVGINNYLHVKVDNENESIVKCSGNFEYKTMLTGIAIQTVPNVTVYYVDASKNNESINVNGGEITLKYSKGNKKIPISTDNSLIKVMARPIKDIKISEEETILSNKWYNHIDLRGPGVWDIRVAYTDNESGLTYDGSELTFYDYYTVTVNNNEERNTNVNSPYIVKGMIPVKWVETERTYYEYSFASDGETIQRDENKVNEGFWITTTENDVEWYDYKDNNNHDTIWANVMLKDEIEIREVPNPKDNKLTLDNLAGKRIDAYGSMFVWIPRFSYKVLTTGSRLFEVNWSTNTTDEEGEVLSAFTYNNKQLTGFWMAKYEASKENDIIEIKPDKVSNFGNITVDDAYTYSTSIVENDVYGITGSAISHLVTMSEWDAIVVLANSVYARSPMLNDKVTGGNTYTGWGYDATSKETSYAKSNSSSFGSTTYNMSGIFDMFGGANEIVSVYIGEEQTNKPIDMERLENGTEAEIIAKEGWLSNKEIAKLNNNNIIIGFFSSVVMRGEDIKGQGGIFTITVDEYDETWCPYVGFRPSILVTEKPTIESTDLEKPLLKIRDRDEYAKYAGVGEIIELTIASTKGVVDIQNMKINGKDPTNGTASSEVTSSGYTFFYKVESGDTNGKVEISYDYKIHSETKWESGRTDVNPIYVDTNAKNIDVGWENNTITIVVKSEGEGDSGVTIIKYVKKTDGTTPSDDELKNGTDIGLGDSGSGTIENPEEGDYYIYIEDEAGNITIKKITISSGSGEGKFEINNITPQLESMTVSAFRDENYATPSYINRLETVKVDMTFDYELTVGPVVYIAGERATVTSDETDKKIWTAICTNIGSQYAYEDIPISISDYEYYGNKGVPANETFDDGTAENPGVKIPYDGSLVKIDIGSPTFFSKTDEVWNEVDKWETGKPMALEYTLTFSDPVYSYTWGNYSMTNTIKPSLSNLDVNSIVSDWNGKIQVNDNMTVESITVRDFVDSSTNSTVPEKKIIRFENLSGDGRFGFTISGAKYSDDLATFTDYVAKDMYNNPNEYYSTSDKGDSNMPIIDTTPPSLTNVTIFSSNASPKYARNGDTITVEFGVSEELAGTPTVTIFNQSTTVTYADGKYVATYLIPDDAEYTEGIVPFSILNYEDGNGNAGNTFTQDNLSASENVIYDITAPVISIDPNGGEFLNVSVNVTLADSPAGIKDLTLKYYWNTEAQIPTIEDSEWSLAPISGGNAVIKSPEGLNEPRYLIIAGVSDNAGNESTSFISNEFIFTNYYEVFVTTSPDTVVDDTDPENVITTPGTVTGGGKYNPGESVTITATPTDGYRFDGWTIVGVDGFTDLTLNEQSFTMPKSNVWATAKFVKQWTVVFKSYDGEVLSTQIVDNGSSAVAPTAPSRSGYSFSGWEPTPSDANYLNVTCDMELVATYSRRTYTITAYAGSNGTITPSGNVSVSYGSSKRFNISPNNGYKVLDVTVDGVSVGAVTTYLFEDVTSNHSIYVTFTEDTQYDLEGEWYYDNIEVEEGNVEYVFRSRETLDENEDASAVLTVETSHRVNVSFDYILNGRTDAMFGFTINGEPFRIIESSDTWTEFNETFEPVDGKIVIGLTYSKGENPTEEENFLDLAAIKNLVVE